MAKSWIIKSAKIKVHLYFNISCHLSKKIKTMKKERKKERKKNETNIVINSHTLPSTFQRNGADSLGTFFPLIFRTILNISARDWFFLMQRAANRFHPILTMHSTKRLNTRYQILGKDKKVTYKNWSSCSLLPKTFFFFFPMITNITIPFGYYHRVNILPSLRLNSIERNCFYF